MKPKNFTPSQEQIDAAETVFLAMAHLGVIKPVVDAYQREILGRHQWTVNPLLEFAKEPGMPETVLDPKLSYLLTSGAAATYHKECNEARQAAGLCVESPEYCPALVAEEDLRQAKRALVDSFKPVTGLGSAEIIQNNFKKYEEFVELTLKLMAPFCDAKGRLEEIRREAAVERPRA